MEREIMGGDKHVKCQVSATESSFSEKNLVSKKGGV